MVAEHMQRAGEQPAEHWVEERDLLSVVHKNAFDSRRAARRSTTSVEQKEKTKGNRQQATYAKEHAVKLEAELQNISDGILALMDMDLIPLESTGELKVFYNEMKSNFYRYLAECVAGDTKGKVAEDVCVVHAEATKMQKTVEVLQVQYNGKAVDVPVVRQGQVPTVQTLHKTVEVPQVQFIDRVVEVPVVTQRQDMPSMPRERIEECIVEEIIFVTVSRVMEKIIKVVRQEISVLTETMKDKAGRQGSLSDEVEKLTESLLPNWMVVVPPRSQSGWSYQGSQLKNSQPFLLKV